MQETLPEPQERSDILPHHPGDSAARNAGLLLIATAVITLVAVAGRVTAGADQPTLVESLAAIADSRLAYGLGGAARFASGVALLGGAWLLLATWIIRQGRASPLVPWLLGASGFITALSGICAVVLAAVAADVVEASLLAEVTEFLRWTTGKLGFTLAGLALLIAARFQWLVGGSLRFLTPLSVIAGAAMLLIWLDGLTYLHRFSGVAFVLWLVTMGFMLSTGRVERLFIAKFESATVESQ